MKEVRVRNKKGKFNLKVKILLAALALAVILGLSTTAQAARKDKDEETEALLQLYRQMRFFNPFTLTISSSRDIVPESSTSLVTFSGGGKRKRPAIRIPFRPILRSPYRPPIAP